MVSKGLNILIICGHGGTPYDPGAVGNGYREAVLTRELGTILKAELTKLQGVTPILYDQSKDAYKVLKNGGSLPLTYVNYVIELHFNAGVNDTTGNGKTTGVEVLVHKSEKQVGVETAICKHISALGFTNRGVKRRSDLLVMNTVKRKGISPCLIEACFIDDKDDMTLYLQKKQAVAQAIAAGVAEGFGLAYATFTTTTKEIDGMITQAQFEAMYNIVNPKYTAISQVPLWYREDAQELKDLGVLQGDGTNEISIRLEELQSAVIALRVVRAVK